MQFDDQDHLDTYGNLYNWYAVDDDKDLCMEGWHVPLNEEWTILIDYLGSESTAGGKMKESGLVHWNSPNTGATNESGFTALPGGYRDSYDGAYRWMEIAALFWSSTKIHTTYEHKLPFSLGLLFNTSYVKHNDRERTGGYSVRCIRD